MILVFLKSVAGYFANDLFQMIRYKHFKLSSLKKQIEQNQGWVGNGVILNLFTFWCHNKQAQISPCLTHKSLFLPYNMPTLGCASRQGCCPPYSMSAHRLRSRGPTIPTQGSEKKLQGLVGLYGPAWSYSVADMPLALRSYWPEGGT